MTENVCPYILVYNGAKKLQEREQGSFKQSRFKACSALKINTATLNMGSLCEELVQTVQQGTENAR